MQPLQKNATPLGPRATEDAVLNVSDMAALDEFGSGTLKPETRIFTIG